MIKKARTRYEKGFVLLTTLFLMMVFTTFLLIYNSVTQEDIQATRASRSSVTGFYAAEAGLNIRSDQIRRAFSGFGNRPNGVGPITDGSAGAPCSGSNNGSGDMACETLSLGERTVTTYVVESPNNPQEIEIPSGERYQGLNATEDRFTAFATAVNQRSDTEAILELIFRNRSVPLFQFGAFYNFDLALFPGPEMTMNGPIHANGSIFLSSGATLTVEGQITATGEVVLGRNPDHSESGGNCDNGDVFVWNQAGVSQKPEEPCSGALTQADVDPFQGMIQFGVESVEVPNPEMFRAQPGNVYWDLSDLRLVLNLDEANCDAGSTCTPDLTNSITGIEVRDAANNVDPVLTAALHDPTECPGTIDSYFTVNRDDDIHLDDDTTFTFPAAPNGRVVGVTNLFHDRRELWTQRPISGASIPQTMLELDIRNLLSCIARLSDQDNDDLFPDAGGIHLLGLSAGGQPKALDDESENGLVIFLAVEGPRSALPQSFYGVRVRNGEILQSEVTNSPTIRGLTLITDQQLYVLGNYNYPTPESDRVPAAFLADAFNVLSESWCDPLHRQAFTQWDDVPGQPKCDLKTIHNMNKRRASEDTFVNAAVLAGSTRQDQGGQTGGLHNFPRFHEDWSGTTFRYRGSLVSLFFPQHADSLHLCCDNDMTYQPPERDWGFDENFRTFNLLPPATPNFTYLKQQLFERTFER